MYILFNHSHLFIAYAHNIHSEVHPLLLQLPVPLKCPLTHLKRPGPESQLPKVEHIAKFNSAYANNKLGHHQSVCNMEQEAADVT